MATMCHSGLIGAPQKGAKAFTRTECRLFQVGAKSVLNFRVKCGGRAKHASGG